MITNMPTMARRPIVVYWRRMNAIRALEDGAGDVLHRLRPGVPGQHVARQVEREQDRDDARDRDDQLERVGHGGVRFLLSAALTRRAARAVVAWAAGDRAGTGTGGIRRRPTQSRRRLHAGGRTAASLPRAACTGQTGWNRMQRGASAERRTRRRMGHRRCRGRVPILPCPWTDDSCVRVPLRSRRDARPHPRHLLRHPDLHRPAVPGPAACRWSRRWSRRSTCWSTS